jgi:N-acetylneuraminic acid mutarotase
MPDARNEFGCVQLDGKIYVIGGERMWGNNLSRTNSMEIFDIVAGKWTEGVPMPVPCESTATLVDGGMIVVTGGYNGTRALADVSVFNPRERTWRSLPPLLHPVSATSLVFLGR